MKPVPALSRILSTILLWSVVSMLFLPEASAQFKRKGFDPIGAIHHGEEFSLEAGIGYHEWWLGFLDHGVGASIESILAKDPVYGIRVHGWIHFALALGFGVGYYTNFDQGRVVLQPEFGFGFSPIRITWRPSIPLGSMLPGMSESDLTIFAVFRFSYP